MAVKTIIGLHGYQFDKQEISRRKSPGMQEAGTFAHPYVEDDWQIIKGVGWSRGKFTVAGGGGIKGSGASPFPISLLNGGAFQGAIAFNAATGDKAGVPGKIGTVDVQDTRFGDSDDSTTPGTARGATMYVGIHGTFSTGQDVWMVGGWKQTNADLAQQLAFTFCVPPPGGNPIINSVTYVTPTQVIVQSPVVLMSTDKGATWTDTNIPRAGPLVDGVNKVIENVIDIDLGDCLHSAPQIFPTKQFSNLDGGVTALGFDPHTRLFWATVAYLSTNDGYSVKFYTNGGGGWGSAGGAVLGTDFPNKAPLPPWPKGTKVNDGTVYFDDAPPKLHAPNISTEVKYAAVNGPGQKMDLGKGKTLGMNIDGSFTGINPPPGMNNAIFNSACTDGLGEVLVAQWGGFNDKPQIFFSKDRGDTFVPILSSFGWAIGGITTTSFA